MILCKLFRHLGRYIRQFKSYSVIGMSLITFFLLHKHQRRMNYQDANPLLSGANPSGSAGWKLVARPATLTQTIRVGQVKNKWTSSDMFSGRIPSRTRCERRQPEHFLAGDIRVPIRVLVWGTPPFIVGVKILQWLSWPHSSRPRKYQISLLNRHFIWLNSLSSVVFHWSLRCGV